MVKVNFVNENLPLCYIFLKSVKRSKEILNTFKNRNLPLSACLCLLRSHRNREKSFQEEKGVLPMDALLRELS